MFVLSSFFFFSSGFAPPNENPPLPIPVDVDEFALFSVPPNEKPPDLPAGFVSLLSAGFGNNDPKNVEKMATAVELLHIATLVHDDTVDDSNFRRGKATISNLWGDNTAVLIGDYIFTISNVRSRTHLTLI